MQRRVLARIPEDLPIFHHSFQVHRNAGQKVQQKINFNAQKKTFLIDGENRYKKTILSSSTNEQVAITNFLQYWLRLRCKALDEFEDVQLYQEMKSLIELIKSYQPAVAETLLLLLSKETLSSSSVPAPPSKSDWVNEIFLDTPSEEIALHLCLVDKTLLCNVHYTEFENQNWMKKEAKERLSPNLSRISTRFL